MQCVNQVDYLMNDLRAIDRFFQEHDYSVYYVSEMNLEKIQEQFKNGYDVLEQNSSKLSGFPTLLYDQVLAYGNKPEITESDKRFLVNVEIWSSLNGGYDIAVEPWHGQEKSDIETQVIKKYFGVPARSISQNSVQKMLKDLETVL